MFNNDFLFTIMMGCKFHTVTVNLMVVKLRKIFVHISHDSYAHMLCAKFAAITLLEFQ